MEGKHSSGKQNSTSDLVFNDEEFLSPDIISVIISRLPPDNIYRLKLLSKSWNQRIKSDDFTLQAARYSKSMYRQIILHCVKGFDGNESEILHNLGSLSVPLELFSPFDYDKKRMLPRLDDVFIVGVTYGLFCFSVDVDRYTQDLIVVNPLTGQSVRVCGITIETNQNGERYNYFTYDDVAREFVIVSAINIRYSESRMLFNIYRSGRKESIQNIASPVDDIISSSGYRSYGNDLYFIGMKKCDPQYSKEFIVMLDVMKINFELHPVFLQSHNRSIKIVDCRGEPGILVKEEKDESYLSYSLWHNRKNNKSISTWSRIGDPISVYKELHYIGFIDGCPVLTDFFAGFNETVSYSRFWVRFLYPGEGLVDKIVEKADCDFVYVDYMFTYYPTLISV